MNFSVCPNKPLMAHRMDNHPIECDCPSDYGFLIGQYPTLSDPNSQTVVFVGNSIGHSMSDEPDIRLSDKFVEKTSVTKCSTTQVLQIVDGLISAHRVAGSENSSNFKAQHGSNLAGFKCMLINCKNCKFLAGTAKAPSFRVTGKEVEQWSA